MDKQLSKKLVILSAIIVFVLACEIPGLTSPAPSNSAPVVSLETIVAGTAAVAQTQTAIFLPSPTNTIPVTLPPQETVTFTETPSPTATVIFIIPTSTSPFTSSSAGSDCELVGLTPYRPRLNPGESFDTTWTFKNTGDKPWLDNNTDFVHSGGTDMHKKDAYDLPYSVPPNGEIAITVSMVAPKNSGSYTTTWSIKIKKETICKASTEITVK